MTRKTTEKLKVSTVSPMDVDLDLVDFAVDTTGSWDGHFPDLGTGDYVVTIGAYDREPELVIVSRRYTSATDPENAAELALSAFAERHDYKTDDQGLLLTVEDPSGSGATGVPAWIEEVAKVTSRQKKKKAKTKQKIMTSYPEAEKDPDYRRGYTDGTNTARASTVTEIGQLLYARRTVDADTHEASVQSHGPNYVEGFLQGLRGNFLTRMSTRSR